MYLKTKTITEVQVYMNGDNSEVDIFTVEESSDVMYGWAGLMAAMGRENKIRAIKMFRAQFDDVGSARVGLREAKAFVEDAMRNR
jgi:ribosomal protein L7/L12